MRLDSRAFGLAAGSVTAALFVLCALAVALAPAWTTSVASSLIHLDLTGIARTITWGGFFGGLLFWSIGVGLVFAAVGRLYNWFAGPVAAAAPSGVAAQRLA